ncbi:MAG TPA: winged helix-turn-helix domain-containing protein, partial [Thermomicrobiales bacterium]|nr:winged helix-turn-helix domain-containing protein [Thermomicrobiales bacterium]
DDTSAQRINRFVDGHPLALQLAAANAHEASRLDFADVAVQRVIEELARTYLADVPDPLTRRTLEAASVVRRITLPLLRAILPDIAPQDGYDRLRALPFVETSRDGLHIHDVIQHALAASLHAADPERHRALRSAAWHRLRADVRLAAPTDLWRYTADMLYLIENPIIREGFFPKDSHRFAFEPALDVDGSAIREIITTTEGPESAQLLLQLWERAPQIFRAAHDHDGSIAGFYVMFDPADVDAQVMRDDPILQHWLQHLAASPMPEGQTSLFIRRWLGRGTGELPSPVQGATWLDLKRAYMELRPRLRRVYMTIWAMDTYAATAQELGFVPLPEAHVTLDQKTYYSALNDLGPQSVDGWLARLVGAELGITLEDGILDIDARELVLDGVRVPLTRLEFETLHYLYVRENKAVSRETLLDEVWGDSYAGGSNVVDVIVRSLRKKLGDRAATVETIWGTGYRYRQP